MLEVCKALKAHGIRGEIKAECFTDEPGALGKIKSFFIDGKEYKTERVKPFGNFALIKLLGVDDMNAAEALRGKVMFVPREQMPVPKEGAYYIDDIVGCVVRGESGLLYGKVEEVLQYGSADVFVLRKDGKTVMFPHLKRVVSQIIPEDKVILVKEEEFEKVVVYED